MIKRVTVIVSISAAIWVLAYIALWLKVSGCFAAFTTECNNAPFEPVRAFVMLDWVYGYQTLLAGSLAALAGGFVYWTAQFQRRTALADRRADARRDRRAAHARQRSELLAVLSSIYSDVIRMYQWVMTENKPAMAQSIVSLERQIALIAPHAPLMVTYLAAMTRDISDDFGLWQATPSVNLQEIIPYDKAVAVLGHLIVCRAYLTDSKRLVAPDGTFLHSKTTFSKLDLELIANTKGLNIRAVPYVDILVDLSNLP